MENSKILTESQKSKLPGLAKRSGAGKSQNLIACLTIILFAVILRLIPHPPNVAPIAAMALFGGAYLNKKYAIAVPIAALFISDLVIGFHNGMPFVYGSFLLIGLIGLWLQKRRNFNFILGATLFSSLLFFIITNFGVWLVGDIYPQTIDGLIRCFYLAIPFFRNTVIGDLIFVGLFFGSFEVILKFSKATLYGYLYKNRG